MLIYMQQINFITHFFLKTLKRNGKLVILVNLAHTPKMVVYIWRNLDVYLQTQNQLHPASYPSDIAKILKTCHFWYFCHAWLHTSRLILSTCKKLLMFISCKKCTSFPMFYWRYWKDMQTSYFGYIRHADCAHHKWLYQFAEIFVIYLHAKNTLHHSFLSWDIIF